MKAFTKTLAVIVTMGALGFGCKPEQSVEPKQGQDPEMGLEIIHERPKPQCMASVFAPLRDSQGRTANPAGYPSIDAVASPYGTVEVANDPDQNFVLVNCGGNWLINQGRVFIGNCNNVPLKPDGTVNTEALPFGSQTPFQQTWTWTVKNEDVVLDPSGCACYAVYLEAVQTDFDGSACCLVGLWAWPSEGSVNVGSDGHGFNACPNPCPFGASYGCYDIDPAAGRTCAEITEHITSGSPLYNYHWFTSSPHRLTSAELAAGGFDANATMFTLSGAVASAVGTSALTNTFNACPPTNVNTNYYVVVSDSRSIYMDLDTLLVRGSASGCCSVPYPRPGDNLSEWDCTTGNGQRKVNVCHIPPGNPANMHTICIAVDALPAHIVDYKPATMPCMGHHSGCHIGPCNPCGPGSTQTSIDAAAAFRLQNNCPGN